MKPTIIVCLLFAMTMSCKPGTGKAGAKAESKDDNKELLDRFGNLMQQALLQNDPLMFEKALALSDTVLRADTVADHRMRCYQNRAMIYSAMGRMEEAIKNKELSVLCMSEDNPERLVYMAAVKTIEKSDSAAYYLARLDEVCDRNLQKGFNENIVLYKIKAIYLRYGEAKAKNYLQKQVSKHPECTVLPYLLDQWDDFMNDNRREIDEMRAFLGKATR